MLKTLLESGRGSASRSPRGHLWTTLSAATHTTLIMLAVAATGVTRTIPPQDDPVEVVHFEPARRVPPAPTTTTRPQSGTTQIIDFVMPPPPTHVSTEIPPIQFGADPTPAPAGNGFLVGGTPSAGIGVPNDGSTAYTEALVDEPVVAFRNNPPPRYPGVLRSAGVDGDVTARFVVDTLGRVEPHSIEIAQASHDLFAAAVRNQLLRARFIPAKVGGRPVRQLAEQRFSFAISR